MKKNSSPLRFGIVGLNFGGFVHVPVLQSLKGVKVVAVADQDFSKAKKFATQHHIPLTFSSFQELLKADLDAVTFALPPLENEKACRLAIKKGLAILSEKPLATSSRKAARLAELAKVLITGVDFEFAELEVFQRLKGIIDKQALGRVRHIQVVWLIESWAQRNRAWSWKTDKKRFGGVTTLYGSHLLYLEEWLFGRARRLFAKTSSQVTNSFTPTGGEPAEDLVHLLVEHTDGVQFAATFGNANPGGSGHNWKVTCDKGTVILNNPGPDYIAGFSMTLKDGRKEKKLVVGENNPTIDGRLEAFRPLAQRFVEAVRKRQRTSSDFSGGARVQKLMEAIHESSKRDKWIEV